MKKYVIINSGIDGIGGGQIYTKNKGQYLEEKGYDVFVIHYHNDKDISIRYLEKFENGYFSELELNFLCVPKKRIKKCIDKMLEYINYNVGDEVIVESNALGLSLWGEELAKRVNGKHIIFSVSEKNVVDQSNLKYTEFKFLRGELATINVQTFSDLYIKSKVVPECGVKKLIAYLGDPVEEYVCPEIDNLELKDKNICIIGRMFKSYVMFSSKKISEYVGRYPENSFSLTIIGMKDEGVISQIKNLFAKHNNVTVNFIDSLSPIPKKVFSMFDLIIGSSGCASLPYRQGALTLCIDIHEDRALGFMGYDVVKSLGENPDAKDFHEYLDEALFTKEYVNREYTEASYPTKEECFAAHDEFFGKSESTKEYFDFNKCTVSKKEKVKTRLYLIFGIKRANKILEFLHKF